MNKIEVKLCLGTTCFVMGSSKLQELVEIVPNKFGKNVAVSAKPCLELCASNWEHTKPPYVKINEEIITEATIEKVLNEIERQIEYV